jgi:hypothetical protein
MVFKYEEKMKLMREATYQHIGKTTGKTPSNAELEMACFKNLPHGHALKGEFCISLGLMRWPFLYVEKEGIENYWFTRMCRALCTHRVVYLIGSASSGKSTAMSVVGMNLWGCSPWDTNFIVTSTDKESLDSKIWGSIRDFHEKDKFGIGVRVDYEDAIVLEKQAKKRDIRDAIKAIALPKGSEGEKAIGKVQGRKNVNIIWACDEFDHMDGFVSGARGNLAAAESFLFWAASNKPEEGSPMHNEAAPHPDDYPLGWETPGLSDLESWRTKDGGICLYFDGEKSPNTLATGKKDPFPMLTRRDYIQTIRDRNGEDSYEWWKYIKAFPKAGQTHDKLLDSKFLERYRALEEPVWSAPVWTTVSGLDAAWTKGGDSCMAYFGRVGVSDMGIKIAACEKDAISLNVKVSGRGTYEEQLSEVFIDECAKRDCHVVAIDISGSGGRLANAIRDVAQRRGYKLEIIAVDSAGRPSEDEYQVGPIKKKGTELFGNRMSEVWVGFRLAVQEGWIRGLSLTAKAVREMSDRRIDTDVEKRWVLEKKDKFKERNQGRSPDAAESLVLMAIAARKHGLGANLVPKEKPKDHLKAVRSERTSTYGWQRPQKSSYNW